MTTSRALTVAQVDAKNAWSRRVRHVGGFIQVAFAALWLIRGSLTIRGGIGLALAAIFVAAITAVIVYGIRTTSGAAPDRPVRTESTSSEP
jgi:hypothetical protein